MAEIDELTQTTPGPQCHPTNIFSGMVVSAGEGASAQAARADARRKAKAKRDQSRQTQQNRKTRCPGNCNKETSGKGRPNETRIATTEIGGNNPKFVAYEAAGFKAIVECGGGDKTYGNLADNQGF
ncbi:MAG: hypothetical protein AAGA84_11920, partial [Pseudomonadota bacterium]